MPGPVFGHIPGYPLGSRFESRAELSEAGVHRHRQAGISGSASEGADSIVLSGGYEDDLDNGDVSVYTGHGGRAQETNKQIADQNFSRWNQALAYSSLNGLPVRVVRGAGHDSPYSPSTRYRYDGLYLVEDYWHETGRSDFRIWHYRPIELADRPKQPNEGRSASEVSDAPSEAPRRSTTVLRIVRDTRQARLRRRPRRRVATSSAVRPWRNPTTRGRPPKAPRLRRRRPGAWASVPPSRRPARNRS